jgi:hypothetical protein
MAPNTLVTHVITPYFEYNVITGYSYYTKEELILNKK